MPMSKPILFNAALALLLALPSWSTFAAPGPSVSAWVEVSKDGKVVDLQWNQRGELSEAETKALAAHLRSIPWTASPEWPYINRFGTTVELDTWREGDGNAGPIRVSRLRIGLGFAKFKPPRYPSSAQRRKEQADLLAIVSVGEDGSARSVRVIRSPETPEYFEREVSDAVQFWRFKNETVDGRPARGVINVPVRFSVGCLRGDQGFAVEAPTPSSSVLQADAAQTDADLIEVAAPPRLGRIKSCEDSAE